MGHEIVYCYKCQTRLTSADFEQGRAVRFENIVSCTGCAPEGATPPPASAPHATPRAASRVTSASTRRHAPRPAVSGARSARSSRAPLFLGLAGAAVLVILVISLATGGSSRASRPEARPPSPAGPPKPGPGPGPKPEVVEKEKNLHRDARIALDKARQFAKAHPDDLDGQIKAYAEAARLATLTPYFPPANRKHQELLLRKKRGLSKEISELTVRAGRLRERKDFGAAKAVFEEARGRHALSEWREMIEKKIAELRDDAEAAYRVIKATAREARSRGDADAVTAHREKVASWGFKELLDDFDRAIREVATKATGLVGYWRLDEASGDVARDSSAKGNHGKYRRNPGISRDAAPVEFENPASRIFLRDGNQYVRIPDDPALRLRGPLTLAAWVKPTGSVNGQQAIIEKVTWSAEEGARAGYMLRLDSQRRARCALLDGNGKDNPSVEAKTSLPLDAWSHVAAVYDGTRLTIYIDGVRRGSSVVPHGPTEGSAPVDIGTLGGGTNFNGRIDDVRIYKGAISAEAVAELARRRK